MTCRTPASCSSPMEKPPVRTPMTGIFSLAAACASKIESPTMMALVPSTLACAVATMSGSGLLFAASSEVVQASGEGFAVDEVEERLDVLGLAGAGQDQAEPALLDLGQQ